MEASLRSELLVDLYEKPTLQVLERVQGQLRMPNKKSITGFSDEHKRHATTTLFAAVKVSTGLVKTGHYKHRQRREFVDFMNETIVVYLGEELLVILDNLNTYKSKHNRWLQRHKNVHFYHRPTHAYWLNSGRDMAQYTFETSLEGASFASPVQVRKAFDDFVEVHNETAAPFEWKAAVVCPSTLRNKYDDLFK